MTLWVLLLRSRANVSWGISYAVIALLAVLTTWIQHRVATLDLSGILALTLCGFLVSVILLLGRSELADDLEAQARPKPQLLTLITMFGLVALTGLGLAALLSTTSRLGFEYGAREVLRNVFIYFAIGLTPAVWRLWDVGPYLVAGTTMAPTSTFALTRSTWVVLLPAHHASGIIEVWIAMGLSVVIAAIVVLKSRK